MSNKRREGFVLGSTMFSILAVGVFLFLNYLFFLIFLALNDEAAASQEFLEVALFAYPTILILSIAIPAYATYVLLKRYS